MPIELTRYDTLVQTWPDADEASALHAYWDNVLSDSWDPESRWFGWSLRIPGRRPI